MLRCGRRLHDAVWVIPAPAREKPAPATSPWAIPPPVDSPAEFVRMLKAEVGIHAKPGNVALTATLHRWAGAIRTDRLGFAAGDFAAHEALVVLERYAAARVAAEDVLTKLMKRHVEAWGRRVDTWRRALRACAALPLRMPHDAFHAAAARQAAAAPVDAVQYLVSTRHRVEVPFLLDVLPALPGARLVLDLPAAQALLNAVTICVNPKRVAAYQRALRPGRDVRGELAAAALAAAQHALRLSSEGRGAHAVEGPAGAAADAPRWATRADVVHLVLAALRLLGEVKACIDDLEAPPPGGVDDVTVPLRRRFIRGLSGWAHQAQGEQARRYTPPASFLNVRAAAGVLVAAATLRVAHGANAALQGYLPPSWLPEGPAPADRCDAAVLWLADAITAARHQPKIPYPKTVEDAEAVKCVWALAVMGAPHGAPLLDGAKYSAMALVSYAQLAWVFTTVPVERGGPWEAAVRRFLTEAWGPLLEACRLGKLRPRDAAALLAARDRFEIADDELLTRRLGEAAGAERGWPYHRHPPPRCWIDSWVDFS
eukprot:TRINITY_DN9095_c0_g1_i1.p1 TRINITY_DN9095_c0_g1~~TRINITY_DN9095_c0_g1_i1.p1  ORF type:complete len:542 (+),score=171.10 TRINITY_DN9095_c0_g1_i1:170-1795(+)